MSLSPVQPVALDDLVVLDLATPRAELAGRLLADLGAEVIKIEPPGGAASRRIPPFIAGRESDPDGSLYWKCVGLNKRSVVLDLAQSAADRDRLRRLAADADIFIESDDPGVLAALGLGYDDLRRVNPGLIYVSVTPFGQTGPAAQRPTTELTIEAAGGLLGVQGDGDRPPIPVGYPQAAFQAGALAAGDALIALADRERTGLGQWLDVSMQEAAIYGLLHLMGFPLVTGADSPGTAADRARPLPPPVPGVDVPGIWEAADGHAVFTPTMVQLGGESLQAAMDWMAEDGCRNPALANVRWTTWMADGLEGRLPAETIRLALTEVAAFFRTKTKNALKDRALTHDMLLGPVSSTADLRSDPHLLARDFWRTVDGIDYPGPVTKLSGTPVRYWRGAPRVGQDQDRLQAPPRPARGPAAPAVRVREAGALVGIRVADFSWIGAGPRVGKILADHGATVVRIESETRPDAVRMAPPFRDNIPGINRSHFYGNFNTSKISAAINLRTAEGRALARRFIAWADVVIENFTPGTMERLGLDYATVSRDHPGLIMLSTTLRGQTGPERLMSGYGSQGAALCGLHSVTGWPDRPPRGPFGAYTDSVAPRYDQAAVMAALHSRRRTGLGQHIDTSQIEAAIHFMEPAVLDYTVNGRVWGARGQTSLTACPHGVYPAQGVERYVAIAVETPAHWRGLCRVAPLGAFAAPAFDTIEARRAHQAEIDAALRAWTAPQDPWALADRLQQAGTPASVVQWPSDLLTDPQLQHRGFFIEAVHTETGQTRYDGFATHFSGTPGAIRRAAPCLGEHTAYALQTLLGVTDAELAEYAAAGALT